VGGEWHTCALLSDGEVKCWGWNAEGQLGLGDTQTRGADETVDQIPAVELGAAWSPAALFAGDNTNCATSTAGRLKCWGENTNGELGLEDKVSRGDGPSEMGDDLPEVLLF
jgi:alpha-tubulin suppressor-like RCC1 family protein